MTPHTPPSNDESKKYFPNNTHNSWKNRLPHHIELNGSWEVGLSSISLPHESSESLLENYLKGLSDTARLLVTSRRKVALSDDSKTATQYNVTYGDIKHRRIDTVHDLLKDLFDVEREKCIIDLGDAWATTLANGESAQFKVIADDEGESFTVTAEDVSSSISNSDKTRPGPYLTMKKIGRTWTVSRSLTIQDVLDRFELNKFTFSATNEVMCKFLLNEIA